MADLRERIRDTLALWSLNGTTESESVDAVADEIMKLVEDEDVPCMVCGKPSEIIYCDDCNHYANMDD